MKLHSVCFLQNLVPCISLKFECNNNIAPLDVSIPSEIPILGPTPIYRNARFAHSVCFCVFNLCSPVIAPSNNWFSVKRSQSFLFLRRVPLHTIFI